MKAIQLRTLGVAHLFFIISRRFVAVLFLYVGLGVAKYYFRDGDIWGIVFFPAVVFVCCMIVLSISLMLILFYERPEARVTYRNLNSWEDMKEFNRKVI